MTAPTRPALTLAFWTEWLDDVRDTQLADGSGQPSRQPDRKPTDQHILLSANAVILQYSA